MNMKRSSLVFLSIAAILWGCGGGGGGGGSTSTNGNGNGGGTGNTTKNDVPRTLVGCVLNNAGSGIQGITVRLLDGANNVIASATTDSNGFFGFFPPASATKVTIPPESFDTNTFFRMYEYEGKTYAPSTLGCAPTIPTVGATKVILNPIVITFKSSTPPTPPTCL